MADLEHLAGGLAYGRSWLYINIIDLSVAKEKGRWEKGDEGRDNEALETKEYGTFVTDSVEPCSQPVSCQARICFWKPKRSHVFKNVANHRRREPSVKVLTPEFMNSHLMAGVSCFRKPEGIF